MPHSDVTDLSQPVAQVAVDVSLPHLDRPFDYLVPPEEDGRALPGVRVRVRFAGRMVDGFVLGRSATTEPGRPLSTLSALSSVVSAERVLAPEVAGLARAVADRYAGTLADVLRLAVPRRHAAAESEAAESEPADPALAARPAAPAVPAGQGWGRYQGGDRWLSALRAGLRLTATGEPTAGSAGSGEPGAVAQPPRAGWTALPGEDWPARLAEAAAAVLASGRGTLVVVPDRHDLARTDLAMAVALGPSRHVALSAELGPRERYRRFLQVSRGQVRVVVGTRAAMFAPVADLGLVVVWDDGDDLHAEPRAPYPHVRDVLVLRAHRVGAAALLGGFAMTAEAALLVRSGWARALVAPRPSVRAAAPAVSAVSDADLARDPLARSARLPHAAFEAARQSLDAGRPVLVSVPRTGYATGLSCALCRRPARCAACAGPLHQLAGSGASCGWCGRPAADWSCPADHPGRRGGLRALVVGADRTAEEIGRAFPSVRVRTSGGGPGRAVVAAVPDRRALVVATPGAEPLVVARDVPPGTPARPVGYGAVLLLDGWLPLSRPDLRAAEEAVRRWLTAAALAVPAAAGGRVVLVADAALVPVQAVVRWDPAGFACRELDDRVSLHFPPAARTVSLAGPADAVADLLAAAALPGGTEVLGPVALSPDSHRPAGPPGLRSDPADPYDEAEQVRMLLRVPLARAADLAAAVKAATAVRSARKADGLVRVQVDPTEVG